MASTEDLLDGFETHSIDAIRAALAGGVDPHEPVGGKAPVQRLIEMYTRSPRFAACLRLLLEAGAELDAPCLEAVLLDDADALLELLSATPAELERRLSLDCAYTSLHGVAALHVCAEYNSVECARVLLEAGANVDERADLDADGLGGQTPLFHTVNSNRNHCRPMMELLIEAGADLDVRLAGLVWGPGREWETVVFDITPISYAQCGLYPQFHRLEPQVYANIDFLYKSRHGRAAPARNVPNAYVGEGFQLGAARGGQAPERADP